MSMENVRLKPYKLNANGLQYTCKMYRTGASSVIVALLSVSFLQSTELVTYSDWKE
jgi:hypothetical protein